MKALIKDNKVVDVQENKFEVHSSLTWVDCDNTVKAGFEYDGTNFISNEQTEEELSEIQANKQAKADLRVSAKAKLVAGEALTQEEADTIVL